MGLDGIRLEVSTSGSHTSMCSTLLDFRVGGTAPCCIDKQMSKKASTLKLLVSLPNRNAPWSFQPHFLDLKLWSNRDKHALCRCSNVMLPLVARSLGHFRFTQSSLLHKGDRNRSKELQSHHTGDLSKTGI